MYIGPQMIINDISKAVGLSYIHTIYQTIDSEFDLEKNCRNYPNDEFTKYKDCDDEFMQQELEEHGLMPFWATKDYNKVTKLRYLLYFRDVLFEYNRAVVPFS